MLGALPAAAQYEPPPMEIFGGISLLAPDLPSGVSGRPVGGQAEFVLNLSEKFSLLIEFGYQKKTIPFTVVDPFTGLLVTQDINFSFATIQTGFRYYAVRNERFSVFGHILTGGFFVSSGGFDFNAGSFTPGGGVEVNLTRKIAIRPIQVDLILSSAFGGTGANVRYGSGIVYRFGD